MAWEHKLSLPVIGAPMFIVSSPELVIAQCKAGIVGSFPALNARPAARLDEWLHQITEELAAWDLANPHTPAAPYAVNQIVHRTNDRLEGDLELCAKWKAPIIITSLGVRADVNQAVRRSGGTCFHDVVNDRFARKAVEAGSDGLVAVAAGAGGHAGALSPFALVQEIRAWFDGPLALSGAIASGASILAAQALGADFAYVGSAFLATHEAKAAQAYKDMVIASSADDIVYTDFFTGVKGNYLRPSIVAAGLDPDALGPGGRSAMDVQSVGQGPKAWRDIWGAGQGIGAVARMQGAAAFVNQLASEYEAACKALSRSGAFSRAVREGTL